MTMKKLYRLQLLSVLLGLMLSLTQSVSAAITGASIDTGTPGVLTTVTITPDDDGIEDRAFIRLTSTVDGNVQVIVDTNGTPGFQPSDYSDPDSWQTADTTMDGYVMASGPTEFVFEGRDNNWRPLANGTYNIRIVVTDQSSGVSIDDSLSVLVQTSGLSGTVTTGGTPIQGARVNAGSPSGWGEGITGSDGTYVISGLRPGSYHVQAEKPGFVGEEYPTTVAVSTNEETAGIHFDLSPSVQITGTISIPNALQSSTNIWGGTEDQLWININGSALDGSDWSWGNAHIHAQDGWFCTNAQSGQDNDMDGLDDLSECATADAAVYALDVVPPPSGQNKSYRIRAEAEGYGSVEYTLSIDENGGAQNIAMVKASRITGTVTLAAPLEGPEPLWIDVNAKTADGNMAWGGGSIEAGQSQGVFEVRSALPGTYLVEVRVRGYKTTRIADVAVAPETDSDVGQIPLSEGAKITGTITIAGDTSDFKTYPDDDGSQPIRFWVDVWSPEANGWAGTEVEIPRGVNASVSYRVGGLNAGTYEVRAWLGEGYEQSPAPLTATLISDTDTAAGVDMTFAPYSGSITGLISGTGLDMTKVVVKAVKAHWDWAPPVFARPASDGSYVLEGLGTSEYLLEINEYANHADIVNGDAPSIPTGNFGSEIRRVAVVNGSVVTGQDVPLSAGSTIRGTVSLEDGYDGDLSFSTDIQGKMVMAMPLKMAMMGGESMFFGPIGADGSYAIPGLSTGAYVVMPPTELRDPGYGGDGSAMQWNIYAPDVAGDEQIVTVSSGQEKTGVDFVLSEGYSVRGTLTLPEAPCDSAVPGDCEGKAGNFVADLQLRHPRHEGKGRNRPVQVSDFNGGRTFSFDLKHVAEGDYVLQAWTPNYTVAHRNISVSGSDVTGAHLELKKGANILGKLVDSDTGEAITPEDGIRVRCEAYPWVEGSWRETWNDPWSESRFLETNGKYTGAFRLANLPPGTYVVTVEAQHGMKTQGAKNYIGIRKAGIVVPETDGAAVDIGTLYLQEGVTISGTVTSAETGLPLGNIEVEAEPVDEKDGTAHAWGTTDSNGKYTIYGIDPEIKYYYVIGGSRPDFTDFVPVNWGEVEKNVEVAETGLTGVDFQLPAADAVLAGTIHKTGSSPWGIPFEDDLPAPMLLLQKEGEIYTDPMDGIETIGDPSDTDTTSFRIDGIVPGSYTLKVFSQGYTTKIIRNIQISAGENILPDTIEMVEGGTVSGTVVRDDGTTPTSSEISEVVAVTADLEQLIFGTLTVNEASREVSAYSVSGLAPGTAYAVVFVSDGDDGPENIWVMPDMIQAGDTYDAVIGDNPPFITGRAKKNEDGTFTIGIFSTSYLNDGAASDILTVTRGDGSLAAMMGPDKMEIVATYTPPEEVVDPVFEITMTAHYGEKNTEITKVFSFDVNAASINQSRVNAMLGGTVTLGQGDPSRAFFEAGDIVEGDGDGVSTITMQKDGSAVAGDGITTHGTSGRSVFAESTPDLPDYVSAASALYDIALPAGDRLANGASVTVSFPYDPSVTDTSDLHIYHYTGGAWVAEDTNRSVDTANNTITADVTSLSPFQVGTGSAPEGGGAPAASGSGGGGGCALAASPTAGFGNIPGLTLLLLPVVLLQVLRMTRRTQV